jgi:hypothetical protein
MIFTTLYNIYLQFRYEFIVVVVSSCVDCNVIVRETVFWHICRNTTDTPPRSVLDRLSSFEEYNDDQFTERFRLTKVSSSSHYVNIVPWPRLQY